MMDFCLQELEAVVSICGLNLTRAELFVEDWATLKARDLVQNACVYIKLPSNNAESLCKQIVARSILVKEIVDVFSETTLEKLAVEKQKPTS